MSHSPVWKSRPRRRLKKSQRQAPATVWRSMSLQSRKRLHNLNSHGKCCGEETIAFWGRSLKARLKFARENADKDQELWKTGTIGSQIESRVHPKQRTCLVSTCESLEDWGCFAPAGPGQLYGTEYQTVLEDHGSRGAARNSGSSGRIWKWVPM